MTNLFKRDVGRCAIFHSHNGKDYNARIIRYHKGVAVIEYAVRVIDGSLQMTTAYIDRPFHHQIEFVN